MASQEPIPIPQPPPSLLFGNVGDLDPTNISASMWHLAEVYGEIFKLKLGGRTLVVCSSYETVNDCCDWSRFGKQVSGSLKEVRALTGDGLFTAHTEEHNWGVAHRILMPVFGPMGIRKMWGGMMDIISQMLLRWDRFGPDNVLDTSAEFTDLTFDAIGLCAFGYRFNNFYSDAPHWFCTHMTDVLRECGVRGTLLAVQNKLRFLTAAKTDAEIKAMRDLCNEIIQERIRHPQPDSKDLLNPMLEGKDPETGEKMTHESVINNMVTFLVAGHETTSGTLSFLFYHLLKNPEKYMAVQEEVDRVLGDKPLEPKHLSELIYVKFAIYEALRFMGPITMNSKGPKQKTRIAGKYEVESDWQILLNLKPFMRDPKVWGDDGDQFKPERFLNGGFERLPPNAWKPFGDGMRSCIGRGFAEQEMVMTVALMVQNFQVEMADPSYDLSLQVALTIKPDQFKIKVRRRSGRDLMASLGGSPAAQRQTKPHEVSSAGATPTGKEQPITVLYGSNSGTCKTYAEELETSAPLFGFKAKVGTLNSATEHVPNDQPVIIISPSYEGKPADNAKKFCQWLQSVKTNDQLKGVNYAVFSVGNSEWAHTFHRVPKFIDEQFEKLGAQRFTETGFVDVKYDIVGPWEDWKEKMWTDLRKSSGISTVVSGGEMKVEITPPKFASHLGGPDIGYGIVKVNRDISEPGVGLQKKHMDVELPPGMSYRSGDYLVVLPINNIHLVRRTLKRFEISPDDSITVTGTHKAFLSPNAPISVFDLLMTRVELGTPATQRQIQGMIDTTPENKRASLTRFLEDEIHREEILGKRYTVLDLLEDTPECLLPFSKYLDWLQPLAPRQYSISSSPLATVEFVQQKDGTTAQKMTASLSYDVHDEPAFSGHGQFHGVASTYLRRQDPGEKIRCYARSTNVNFHLPLDPLTPIIMICAGTGIAPMRGFIQERATMKAARKTTFGSALLYFGCRDHTKDYIYADELAQWEKDGVVSVRPCFSKNPPSSEGKGHKYVPDRMWEEREELKELFQNGAKIFVCGSAAKLGKSTADVCKKIWREASGKGEKEADEWLEKVREDRYVSDTFE
ncbi:hypothetical protein PMIN06_008411 [Paraphaeosphaeria minitans]